MQILLAILKLNRWVVDQALSAIVTKVQWEGFGDENLIFFWEIELNTGSSDLKITTRGYFILIIHPCVSLCKRNVLKRFFFLPPSFPRNFHQNPTKNQPKKNHPPKKNSNSVISSRIRTSTFSKVQAKNKHRFLKTSLDLGNKNNRKRWREPRCVECA